MLSTMARTTEWIDLCNSKYKDWITAFNSFSASCDGYYDAKDSIFIFQSWCNHHGLDMNEICVKLSDFLNNPTKTFQISGPDYCGQHFIFKTLQSLTSRFITIRSNDYTLVKCLDVPLMYAKCKKRSLLPHVKRKEVSFLLFTQDLVRESNDDDDDVTLLMLTKPFAWFEGYNLELHPAMWKDLLTFTSNPTCYGCLVDHPSQIQHMGIGGCLNEEK